LTIENNRLTVHEAHDLLKTKKISSVELTRACLEQIDRVDSKVCALVTVTGELALQQAQKADELIAAGSINPLTGIPAVITTRSFFLSWPLFWIAFSVFKIISSIYLKDPILKGKTPKYRDSFRRVLSLVTIP